MVGLNDLMCDLHHLILSYCRDIATLTAILQVSQYYRQLVMADLKILQPEDETREVPSGWLLQFPHLEIVSNRYPIVVVNIDDLTHLGGRTLRQATFLLRNLWPIFLEAVMKFFPERPPSSDIPNYLLSFYCGEEHVILDKSAVTLELFSIRPCDKFLNDFNQRIPLTSICGNFTLSERQILANFSSLRRLIIQSDDLKYLAVCDQLLDKLHHLYIINSNRILIWDYYDNFIAFLQSLRYNTIYPLLQTLPPIPLKFLDDVERIFPHLTTISIIAYPLEIISNMPWSRLDKYQQIILMTSRMIDHHKIPEGYRHRVLVDVISYPKSFILP